MHTHTHTHAQTQTNTHSTRVYIHRILIFVVVTYVHEICNKNLEITNYGVHTSIYYIYYLLDCLTVVYSKRKEQKIDILLREIFTRILLFLQDPLLKVCYA